MTACPTCGRYGRPPASMTATERDLMRIIVECFDRDGTTPSYRAMMREMELAGSQNIQRLVVSLERKGWIRRRDGGIGRRRARGLRILHRPPMPDFATPAFRLAKAG